MNDPNSFSLTTYPTQLCACVSHASDASSVELVDGLQARRFGTRRGLATLRPSTSSCCARRFDIDSSQWKRKGPRWLQEQDAFINFIEQSDQPVLFLTSERSFGWDICDLRRGVNKLDLYLRVKVDPVKQPTKRNSVCAGNVSHRRTFAFHHHLVHRIVVFKDEQ